MRAQAHCTSVEQSHTYMCSCKQIDLAPADKKATDKQNSHSPCPTYYIIYTHIHIRIEHYMVWHVWQMFSFSNMPRNFVFGTFPSFLTHIFVFLLLFTDLLCLADEAQPTNIMVTLQLAYICVAYGGTGALSANTFVFLLFFLLSCVDKTRNMREATICRGTHKWIRSRYAKL